jgi:hypothetical protein
MLSKVLHERQKECVVENPVEAFKATYLNWVGGLLCSAAYYFFFSLRKNVVHSPCFTTAVPFSS